MAQLLDASQSTSMPIDKNPAQASQAGAYNFSAYPMIVRDKEGKVIGTAQDHEQHGKMIGEQVRPDGTLVRDSPRPLDAPGGPLAVVPSPTANPDYVPQPYPMVLRDAEGKVIRTVQDHIEHSLAIGIEHGPDGKPLGQNDAAAPSSTVAPVPVADPPKTASSSAPGVSKRVPPTLQEVMSAGYSEENAQKIVAREQAKADAGEPPYGDKPAEVAESNDGQKPAE